MTDRRWWSDENYKAELESKANAGNWYILVTNINPATGEEIYTPVIVSRIIFAGYKSFLPDKKTTINVNPDRPGNNSTIRDIDANEYEYYCNLWHKVQEKVRQAIAEKDRLKAERRAFQNSCQHSVNEEEIRKIQTVKAAGFDQYEISCTRCDKVLRRYSSTAYENDPRDQISDWAWYLRYCHHEYNGYIPNLQEYDILEFLGDYGDDC